MRCWSFPRRAGANGDGGGGERGGDGDDRRHRSGGSAAPPGAGPATIVESADETNVAVIIYDSDAVHDAIEVATASSPRDADAVTDATTCSDSSWGEEDDDDDDDDEDNRGDEGATKASADAAIDDPRDLLRGAADAGSRAIGPEFGASLPVAMPVGSNDDSGTCRRGRLLRTVTPTSALTRARRTLIHQRTGGRRNWQLSR
jgi:hypothetical protein